MPDTGASQPLTIQVQGHAPQTVHVPAGFNIDPSLIAQGFQHAMPVIADIAAKNYQAAVADGLSLVQWAIAAFAPKPAPAPAPVTPPTPPVPTP